MRPVDEAEVELGTPLPWSVYDRAGKLLFVQGMVVACQSHLEIILERGLIVPETATSAGALAPMPGEPAAEAANDDPADAGEGEPAWEPEQPVFRAMQQLRRELQLLQERLLACAWGMGGEHVLPDPGDEVHALAERLQALVRHDADAALAAMQLEVGDDGEIARMLHAATLCQVLLQARPHEPDEALSVLSAALTYDLALGPMAAILNRQQGGLTADQQAMIHTHPQAAVELLQAAGVDDETWLQAIAQHHERIDGSGYPAGLSGTAISAGARMLAIVDIYSAMVRPRAYREAVHARNALRNLFLERGRAVDDSLATLLVREIGVFPPGTPVRLANGEVGVVWRRGSNAAHPLVARLVNANGTLAAIAVKRDTALPEYAITGTAPPNKYQSLVSGAGRLWE